MSPGRSTPQHCMMTSTPRRESKNGARWFGINRLLVWLLVIALWAYLAFCVQSLWAHDDDDDFSGFGSFQSDKNSKFEDLMLAKNNSLYVNIETAEDKVIDEKYTMDVALAKKNDEKYTTDAALAKKNEYGVSSKLKTSSKKRSRRGKKRQRREHSIEEQEPEIPQTNGTYGFLVGPFGSIEDRVLQWSPKKRGSERCNRKGEFARLVRSKRFVLIFHELSMTGAPLSMMELATELLNCGASVSAVVLSRKGGLMQELVRRQIKVLQDKADFSFRTAIKADLVIAGSAVCASWIEQYIEHFPAGASHVAWWIMENRREYFDRSKDVLHRVKMLVFLSDSQSKQWQRWCEEESIKLSSQPALVPLSVNDELAFVAGLSSTTLNTQFFNAEKRKLLRDSVRREMGLTHDDMLVISLSSINRGKGQLLLLESANSIVEHDKKMKNSLNEGQYLYTIPRRNHTRNNVSVSSPTRRKVYLSQNNGTVEQSLKILIGSVGSKSNKVEYVKSLLSFLAQHSNLSKSVLWTPSTTRVASLYSAADVYVINSQGLGETFGRVTIEAMAFGLPVLGTNGGGTQEIVEHNVTGLVHPFGRRGNHVLSHNLRFLLENPMARVHMGMEGRNKVQKMYLKHHMYSKFAEVLVRCMTNK